MSDVETAPDGADEEVSAEESGPEVELLHGCPTSSSVTGDLLVHTTPETYLDLVAALKDDGFVFLVDLCAVDYLTHPGRLDLPAGVDGERYEVVAQVLEPDTRRRIRVRCHVAADDPTCPSLFDLHAGCEAMEREAFDMVGVTFSDHPDMTRILMPEDWEGHPLRKDYGVGAIPVQFKASNAGR